MTNIYAKVLVPAAVLPPPAAEWAAALALPVFSGLQWLTQRLLRRPAVLPVPAAGLPAGRA